MAGIPQAPLLAAAEGSEGPLLYHERGAGVQHAPTLHLIFWGANFNREGPGPELRSVLFKLYEGLSGSSYQGILTQYFDATGRVSPGVSVSSYNDEGVSAPTLLTQAKVEEEVHSAIEAKKWSVERGAQFVILTAPGSSYEGGFGSGFCAYHGVTKSGAVYAFVPYQGDPPFSTDGCVERGNPDKNPIHKTSKSASQQYADTVTDPEPGENTSEWTAAHGAEIGSPCETQADLELQDGAWVQNLYDDHLNECAHEDSRPPFLYAVTGPASSITGSAATVKGTVNAEEPETKETAYDFEYGLTSAYGGKAPVPAAGATGRSNVEPSQAVSCLKPETTYHYRLAASNSTGTTAGEDSTFKTSAGVQPPAPTVTKVRPAHGPAAGGTEVVISGEHLECVGSVRFGEASGSEVRERSATELTVRSPAHMAGTVDVTITTPSGESTKAPADQFVYVGETAVAWGEGGLGQLGNGATASSDVPVHVCALGVKECPSGPYLEGVKTVSGGDGDSIALLKGGTAVAWGDNRFGQLGNGATTDSDVPVKVCAVGVKECPSGPYLEGVIAVASGGQHNLALLSGGTLVAWGRNGRGQLGDGTTSGPERCLESVSCSRTPVRVCAAGATECPSGPYLEGVSAIAGGEGHSLALKGGAVTAWGYNFYGQLGNGTTTDSDVPVKVCAVGAKECPSGPYLEGVAAIAGGAGHSLAVLSTGTAVAWGENFEGALGNGTANESHVPVKVCAVGDPSFTECSSGPYLEGVTGIAGGYRHSLAALGSNGPVAWGTNGEGPLGNGGERFFSRVPVKVCAVGAKECPNGPHLEGVTAIAAGGNHSLAELPSGRGVAWGANQAGELGNGRTTNSTAPVFVDGLNEVTSIAAGGSHTLATGTLSPIPTVTGIAPSEGSGLGGTTVTISGNHLSEVTAVSFGETPALSFTIESATKVVATSPPGRGTVDVTVGTAEATSGTNAADRFSYWPMITKVTPNQGSIAGGTRVTITGTHLKQVKAVKFGSAEATIVEEKPETELIVTSPAGSGTVDVQVTTAEGTTGTSAADQFTYLRGLEEGHPELFDNFVRLTASHVGQLGVGVIKMVAPTLEDELECVNLAFGAAWNEGTPAVGHGQVLAWQASGNASVTGTGANRQCAFKKGTAVVEAWARPELPVVQTGTVGRRGEPLTLPWNVEVRCGEREEEVVPIVRLGVPSGTTANIGCRTEAEELSEIEREEAERKGCYASPVPAGCIKVNIIQPGLGLETMFEGTLRPTGTNGFGSGLNASRLKFEGTHSGSLRLATSFATGLTTTGSVKVGGFGASELAQAK